MARYADDYRRRGRRGRGPRRRWSARAREKRLYGGRYPYRGAPRYGYDYRRPDDARLPRKPARGYPVRGVHTYDMDYGKQAGGPDTDYSGRAGYPEGEAAPPPESPPRGRYTPRLEERDLWIPQRRRRRPPRHWSTEEPPRGGRPRGRGR